MRRLSLPAISYSGTRVHWNWPQHFFTRIVGTAGEQQISPLRGFAAPLEMTKKRWTPGIELIPPALPSHPNLRKWRRWGASGRAPDVRNS